MAKVSKETQDGSPPHTWGPLLLLAYLLFAPRFTPTHVGTTSSGNGMQISFSVHPHTRGDHSNRFSTSANCFGSPPHTWGPHLVFFHEIKKSRFTPTHVGTTLSSGQEKRAATVHPHTRGDHFDMSHFAQEANGSPPHTWGPP